MHSSLHEQPDVEQHSENTQAEDIELLPSSCLRLYFYHGIATRAAAFWRRTAYQIFARTCNLAAMAVQLAANAYTNVGDLAICSVWLSLSRLEPSKASKKASGTFQTVETDHIRK